MRRSTCKIRVICEVQYTHTLHHFAANMRSHCMSWFVGVLSRSLEVVVLLCFRAGCVVYESPAGLVSQAGLACNLDYHLRVYSLVSLTDNGCVTVIVSILSAIYSRVF